MSRSTDNDPLLGRVLDGKFTLQSVLGRGGMGVVYRAYQRTLERPVALKLLRGFSGDESNEQREAEFQRRFFLEAATAAKLKHPNTITVFDYGSTAVDGEKVFYITMELLDGMTLSKVLQMQGPLAPLRTVHIALQICRSLREAHAAGIVHRDLKPGNVMLVKNDDDDDGDFVKVLDFGLAKTKGGAAAGPQLTKAGTFLGSPRYVAPEQIEGRVVDRRADIYSLGCVLFRMLTGQVPFDGQQPVEVMYKHLNEPIPPLRRDGLVLPDSLEQLVMRCLAKKADDRPSSMDDVIAELKRARGELGGVYSGNITIPDDVRERLRAELHAATTTSSTPSAATASAASPPPAAGSSLMAPTSTAAAETTASSRPAPRPGPAATAASASAPPSTSDSSPSSSRTNSGEWQFVGGEESSRLSRPSLAVVARPRRTWPSVAAGIVVGVLIAAVIVADRTGALEEWLASVVVAEETPAPSFHPPGPRATESTAARVNIKTSPVGADVFEVTPEGTKLIGITPLLLPWDIAVGDRGREFFLKKAGFVPSRARVDPPLASPNGAPVLLEIDALLRPLPGSAP
jgi:serine/threonine-protein kinase